MHSVKVLDITFEDISDKTDRITYQCLDTKQAGKLNRLRNVLDLSSYCHFYRPRSFSDAGR